MKSLFWDWVDDHFSIVLALVLLIDLILDGLVFRFGLNTDLKLILGIGASPALCVALVFGMLWPRRWRYFSVFKTPDWDKDWIYRRFVRFRDVIAAYRENRDLKRAKHQALHQVGWKK